MIKKNNVQPLDGRKHGKLCVQTTMFDDPTFSTNNVMVIPSEISQLVFEYPLFITKANQTESKQFTALLGINAGQNLFIENGVWNSKFIPLDILRRPFCLISQGASAEEQYVVAIDTSSSLLSTSAGTSIFNQDGKPSEFLERIKNSFSLMITGQEQANTIFEKADAFNLIEELTIDYQMHGQTHALEGFYGISLDKINQLSSEDLKSCFDCGLIKVAYLLDVSRQNLHNILNKHEASNPTFNL